MLLAPVYECLRARGAKQVVASKKVSLVLTHARGVTCSVVRYFRHLQTPGSPRLNIRKNVDIWDENLAVDSLTLSFRASPLTSSRRNTFDLCQVYLNAGTQREFADERMLPACIGLSYVDFDASPLRLSFNANHDEAHAGSQHGANSLFHDERLLY